MRAAAEIVELVLAGAVPNLAYLSVGLWVQRAVRDDSRGVERFAIAYALGAGASSLLILLLRAADVAIPLGALAVLAVAGAPVLRGRTDRSASVRARTGAGWIRAVDAATLLLGGLTFVAALAPETYWDGFEYHLPMIRAWSEGPIRALPAMIDSEIRAGIDLLYLPAVAAGHSDAAAAVSACFAMALAALVRAEATRRASPAAGAVAALFVLIVPLATAHAASTYVDIGVGVFGFLALREADRWNRGGAVSTLIACAAFAAFAANAKLHAAIAVPAVAAIWIAAGRFPKLRTLAPAVALYAVLTIPWFVKSALTSGNPFFPVLGDIFGFGSSAPALVELRGFRLSTDFPFDRGLFGFAHYLASIHLGANPHVGGLIGPLPLALAPFAFAKPTRAALSLAGVLVALLVLQFVFMPALRFGIPVLAFLAVAAAVGGARLAASGRGCAIALGMLFSVLALHHLAGVATEYGPRVAALREPGLYRQARFPDQVALAEMVGRAQPVVGIPKGAVFWMPKPVYNLHWERNGELFLERTRPQRALAVLRGRGVRSLVLDVEPQRLRDGKTGRAPVDSWLRDGIATLHVDDPPPRARGSRVWVRVDFD